jgi:O-antigen ligase
MPHWAFGEWKTYGVPVKDYIAQSAEFSLAAFGSFWLALNFWRGSKHGLAGAFALLGSLFLLNILFVTSSRTSLVTVPVLLALFLLTLFKGKIRAAMLVTGIGVIAAVWIFSPLMRERLMSLPNEIQQFRDAGTRTSAGDRLDFWLKGAAIVREAPVFGHGTGAIREMYQRAAIDKSGKTIEVTDNPHNQTFAVAIQIGLAGAAVLWAMWLSHFWLFLRGDGVASFIGLAIVAQNVVGSLFNSHLFDFTHGWIYAFGVGVAGGALLAQSRESKSRET